MKRNLNVVFDTNIYLSAILFGGNPRTCLEFAREGSLQLATSSAVLLELSRKLYEKFLWSGDDVREVIEGIGMFATVVRSPEKVAVIKDDESDNRILECAKEAKADYIISGDKKHLLSLRDFENIPILSAKQFLDLWYKKK